MMIHIYLDKNTACGITSYYEKLDIKCNTSFIHGFINVIHILCFCVFGMQIHCLKVY